MKTIYGVREAEISLKTQLTEVYNLEYNKNLMTITDNNYLVSKIHYLRFKERFEVQAFSLLAVNSLVWKNALWLLHLNR